VEDSLRRLAECSQALGLLVEAVAEVTADGVHVRPAAGDGHARVTVSVPPRSVQDFLTLNEVLESAVKSADGGEYLSGVTSAAAQSFRRWLCQEVLVQSSGARPTA
jgi:hypothetical protein